jgi:hypothetical protein
MAVSKVSGAVVFDGTFTGADLNALVTSGAAVYPAARTVALTGSRLDFGVGNEYGEILYRLPIAASNPFRSGLVVEVTLDWELAAPGTGGDPLDNDISVGIADGSRIIAVKASNQGRVEIYHAADEDVAPYRHALPSVAFPFASPWTSEFTFGNSQDVSTSTALGTANLSLSEVPFDQTDQLQVLLLADDASERYGIKSLSIHATAIPEPVSFAVWVVTILLGITGIRCISRRAHRLRALRRQSRICF